MGWTMHAYPRTMAEVQKSKTNSMLIFFNPFVSSHLLYSTYKYEQQDQF